MSVSESPRFKASFWKFLELPHCRPSSGLQVRWDRASISQTFSLPDVALGFSPIPTPDNKMSHRRGYPHPTPDESRLGLLYSFMAQWTALATREVISITVYVM